MKKNFYEILQVRTTASSPEIKSAYKHLIEKLKRHPDRARALQYAKVAQKAAHVLLDSKKRRQYDEKLLEQRKNPTINLDNPNAKGKISQSSAEDIANALHAWLYEDQKTTNLQKNAKKTLELFAQKKKKK